MTELAENKGDNWLAGQKYAEIKPDYALKLLSYGANKVSVIFAVQSINGLGLAEIKKMVECAPVVIDEGWDLNLAERSKGLLEYFGAEVDLIKVEPNDRHYLYGHMSGVDYDDDILSLAEFYLDK